jgi:hypothetical protein
MANSVTKFIEIVNFNSKFFYLISKSVVTGE